MMTCVRSKTAFYPYFGLGHKPQAIECQISMIEANGKLYVKTPFAFLNAYGDDDIERMIDGRRFYETAAECEAYLAYEYPWWERAQPIMDELMTQRYHYNDLVGSGRAADKFDVSVDAIYKLARGHKSFTLKQVKDALKLL